MEQKLALYIDVLPVGAVILWYGQHDTLPDGWALCDGTGNFKVGNQNHRIPDLQGQFVRGCLPQEVPGHKGGQDEVTLTLAQLPSHRHEIQMRHKFESDPAMAQSQLMASVAYERNIKGEQGTVNVFDRGGTGAIKFEDAFSNLARETLQVSSVGGDEAVNIVPSYTALYYILKVR